MRRFAPMLLMLVVFSLVAYLLWIHVQNRALSTLQTLGLLGIEVGVFLAILRELGRTSRRAKKSRRVAEALASATNERFGFSFLHPLAWDRFDPANADGNGFVHPRDFRVCVFAWGQYAASIERGQDPVHHEIDARLATASNRKGFELLGKAPQRFCVGNESGGNEAAARNGTPAKTCVDGWRLSYRTGRGSKSTTYVEGFACYDRVLYAISCQAPSSVFPAYEDLYARIVDSLQIHRDRRA